MSALTDLWAHQTKIGANNSPHPRQCLKDLIDVVEKEENERARDNFDDRGENTLADGYTSDAQIAAVVNYFWTRNAYHGLQFRGALAFLLSHYFLLRSESIRSMELTDLYTVNLDNEAFSAEMDCPALVMIMTQGKTNTKNRKDLVGCMRNKRVDICAFAALGAHFFWRFHVENEPFPNLVRSREWYPIKVCSSSSDKTKKWGARSHYDQMLAALRTCHIPTSKITHINRGSGARMADLRGVAESQIRRQGGWNSDAMNRYYMTGLPLEMMRAMAGFTRDSNSFYLSRAVVAPSDELCRLMFPEANAWRDRLSAREADPNNGDDMVVTLAAGAFLKMIFSLRKSFIQDSVPLSQIFPNHPIWQHSFWQSELYKDFKRCNSSKMHLFVSFSFFFCHFPIF